MFTESARELGEPGEQGQTREDAKRENSEHLGTRQVKTERRGQAPTWCALLQLDACMRPEKN